MKNVTGCHLVYSIR